jgi:hypothetical protein
MKLIFYQPNSLNVIPSIHPQPRLKTRLANIINKAGNINILSQTFRKVSLVHEMWFAKFD